MFTIRSYAWGALFVLSASVPTPRSRLSAAIVAWVSAPITAGGARSASGS